MTVLCARCNTAAKPEQCDLAELMPLQTVEELEAEMVSVETMITQLRRKQTMLRRKINLLSCTAQVPPEILVEIFRLVCQHPRSELPVEQPITPLFFGGVCREWRDIAWSTPLLWNTVSMHISRKDHGKRFPLLKDWLLRAQSSPLFIRLSCDDERGDEANFFSLRAIMDVLVARSKYWHTLDCLLPPLCHDILNNNAFPMLTSVSIRPPKGTISTFCEPPDMFLSSPKLYDVDLLGYNFSSMQLPWTQLRRFRTQFLTVAEGLKVLQHSPDLRECHLESVYIPNFSTAPSSDILHSHLRSLDLILAKSTAISMLDHAVLPSLTDLKIHYHGTANNFRLGPIKSLVSKSNCNLEHLTLKSDVFDATDLMQCLESVPSVTHLRLEILNWRRDPVTGLRIAPFDAFRLLQPSGYLLPNLTSFVYRGEVFCEGQYLVGLFAERWGAHKVLDGNIRIDVSGEQRPMAALRRVEINSPTKFSIGGAEEKKLEALRDEGMEVKLRWD